MARLLLGVAGALFVLIIMWDAFEALVLPRRVTRRLRPARLFYRSTWWLWRTTARRMAPGPRRETYLSFYGPLSLLVLLTVWAMSLVIGFGMVYWGLRASLDVARGTPNFVTDLYMSGTTFFTLGLGDVTPSGVLARILTVVEAGTGFGFLAVVIGYLPVVYQGFSRREVNISLLDARAGSPPSAGELLRRHWDAMATLEVLLQDWERWAAELLESHVSYPVLSYFRSQHDNQSWLGALTCILDTCALIIVGIAGAPARQARLTFAMARHAAVDLAQVLGTAPADSASGRLPG
ncbi:MAG TPA: potassium channel family protein, partial [Candidatus Methylomirabilis sp.]|nr:potassium channel family protein [Candidatus Methylomirabilis sp.]